MKTTSTSGTGPQARVRRSRTSGRIEFWGEVQDFLDESFDAFLNPFARSAKSSEEACLDTIALYYKRIADYNDIVRESTTGAVAAAQSERR